MAGTRRGNSNSSKVVASNDVAGSGVSGSGVSGNIGSGNGATSDDVDRLPPLTQVKVEILQDARVRLARLEREARHINVALQQYESAPDGESRPSGQSTPDDGLTFDPRGVVPDVDGAVAVVQSPNRRPPRHTRRKPAKTTSTVVQPQLEVAARPASSTRGALVKPGAKPKRRRAPRPPVQLSRPKAVQVRAVPAWLLSLTVHGVILGLLGLLTFAAIPKDPPVLEVTMVADSDVALDAVAEIHVEQTESDQPIVDTNFPEDTLAATIPPERFEVATVSAFVESRLGDYRVDDLLTGVSGPRAEGKGRQGDSGKRQSSGGRASFFGAESLGERFLFLVDNSNSMVGGRFETALAELARSVDMMSAQQSFYVLFYSDAAYRLFHPAPVDALIPASRANKQKLHQWLGTVQMCKGGQLIQAMEIVATLDPQVIFLLSDGVIGDRYVKHLTEPTEQRPIIHTLGMTVPNQEAAQKLAFIAEANGGTFRPVAIAPLARELARRRPVKKNRIRAPVWGIRLPRSPESNLGSQPSGP